MLIHLMQHGACLSKELDPTQPLSPIGKEQIERSAQAARILGLRFELVVTSPKVRARQTAEIMAQSTGYPVARIQVTEAVKAMAPVNETMDFLREYDGLDSVLVVGHLPSLGNVASAILSPKKEVAIAVENGGLIQLEMNLSQERGLLNWSMTAAQLAVIGQD